MKKAPTKWPLFVSPAYAGIGPEVETLTGKLSSFPRVCGDRPLGIRARASRNKFPPRMRG